MVRIVASPDNSPAGFGSVRKNTEKKYVLFTRASDTYIHFRVRKLARRDELRKSIAIVRQQLIGGSATTKADEDEGEVVKLPTHLLLDLKILICTVSFPIYIHYWRQL